MGVMKKVTVTVYTTERDPLFGKSASCGFGAVIEYKGKGKYISGGDTRINRYTFELQSAIKIFGCLNQPCDIYFVTTSKYLYQTISFLNYYAKKDFKKRDGKEIKNSELVKQLYELCKIHRIKAEWKKSLVTDSIGASCITMANSMALKNHPQSKPFS